MRVSVEISMYPLAADYMRGILEFIEALHRHPGIEVHTNPTSTHVFGDYDRVLGVLGEEMKRAHQQGAQAAFVLKVLGGDVRPVT